MDIYFNNTFWFGKYIGEGTAAYYPGFILVACIFISTICYGLKNV
jgi:hypothetical protein